MDAQTPSSSRPPRGATAPHSRCSCGGTSARQPCSPRSCSGTVTTPRTSCRTRSRWCTEPRAASTRRVHLPPGSSRLSGGWRRTGGHATRGESGCSGCGTGLLLPRRRPNLSTVHFLRVSTRRLLDVRWRISHQCSGHASSSWLSAISPLKRWQRCMESANRRCGSICSAHVSHFAACLAESTPTLRNHDGCWESMMWGDHD